MLPDELTREGDRMFMICNACRYCEGYCPVFPAVERRLTFSHVDLTYLANLCHNCGECLYACQYAPPHEFALNLPRTLAQIRVASYEHYCWPRPLAAAFRRSGTWTTVVLTLVSIAAVSGAAALFSMTQPAAHNFYAVLPHDAMVLLFGSVMGFVVAALVIGFRRFWEDQKPASGRREWFSTFGALRDALMLTHLHGNGADCTSGGERRSPFRRWCHHLTLYGFALCVASTSVAGFYHSVLGRVAPYPYASLPVLLGTVGGVGLLIGPAGLFVLRRRRDSAMGDPTQVGLDESFIALLWLSTLTGMLLLAVRETAAMRPLLIVHLGLVLALFMTLPYGKFVHGIYRTAALVKSARETTPAEREEEIAPPDPTLPYEAAGTATNHADAIMSVRD